MTALPYLLAFAGLALAFHRAMALAMRNIDARLFARLVVKLVEAGSRERALKLCHATGGKTAIAAVGAALERARRIEPGSDEPAARAALEEAFSADLDRQRRAMASGRWETPVAALLIAAGLVTAVARGAGIGFGLVALVTAGAALVVWSNGAASRIVAGARAAFDEVLLPLVKASLDGAPRAAAPATTRRETGEVAAARPSQRTTGRQLQIIAREGGSDPTTWRHDAGVAFVFDTRAPDLYYDLVAAVAREKLPNTPLVIGKLARRAGSPRHLVVVLGSDGDVQEFRRVFGESAGEFYRRYASSPADMQPETAYASAPGYDDDYARALEERSAFLALRGDIARGEYDSLMSTL